MALQHLRAGGRHLAIVEPVRGFPAQRQGSRAVAFPKLEFGVFLTDAVERAVEQIIFDSRSARNDAKGTDLDRVESWVPGCRVIRKVYIDSDEGNVGVDTAIDAEE